MKHLSDEQIQDYLDGNIPEQRGEIENHLESCRICRLEMRRYQKLSLSLKEDEDFELSPNFASEVVASLQEEGAERFLYKLSHIILWAAGAVMAIALLIRFTDFENAFRSFGNISSDSRGLFYSIFGPLKRVVESSGLNFELIGGIAAVLLMIFVIDRVISRARKHLTATSLI